MKKTCLMVAILFSLSFSALASLDWAQALKSGPALRSYLEERSVQAWVSVDGEHIYQSSSNYTQVGAANSTDLREAVRNARLLVSFDPLYPDFWTRVQYSDVDGNCTIYGVERVTAMEKNGVWFIPTTVNLRVPNYMVALPLPKGEVWSAYVKIFDSQGNLAGFRNCDIFTAPSGQQYLRYPGWITGDQLAAGGESAELQLVKPDGQGGYTTTVINPATGLEKPAVSLETSLNPLIEGREYLAPNQNVIVEIPAQNSIGINPVYQLPITERVTVTVKAKTTEGEVAASFQYRRLPSGSYMGDAEWTACPTGAVTLEPGVYDLWFEWQDFHEETYRQMWDYYSGGGKG